MNVEELFNNLDFENYSYFYHITGGGNGESICNEGLLMEEKELRSTTIEIKSEMIKDVKNFILNERGNNVRKTDEMVIISCPKEEVNYLVKNNNYISSNWENDKTPEYIIPSEYIMGYIDMRESEENFTFTANENYYFDEYGYGR